MTSKNMLVYDILLIQYGEEKNTRDRIDDKRGQESHINYLEELLDQNESRFL